MKKDGRRWVDVATVPTSNFSGELVKQVLLPSARRGELYHVQTTGENGRILNSPDITIKKKTIADLDIVRVEPLTGGSVRLSWVDEKRSDTMIYFLVVEEKDGDTLAGIYTREKYWQYPLTRTATLSIGLENPPPLYTSREYTAKLVVVDFDGWVSTLDRKTFTYSTQ